MNILVTGAGGFVGAALCQALSAEGIGVTPANRQMLGDLGTAEISDSLFRTADAVIHLAARVHMMRDRATDPLAVYRRVNVEGTRRLVEAAARAGVRRVVYLSSVKVNGETSPGRPFTESDPPQPSDAYGVSKFEAEGVLAAVSARTGIETVVVRAPLVYGPGVRGNFLALLRLCDSGIPLPLASVRNRRSLIYVGNLVDALRIAAVMPAAVDKTYLVRDPEDLSTPALIARLRRALGRPPRLIPFPPALLRTGAQLFGQAVAADRLLGNLALDDSRIRRDFAWQPVHSVEAGFAATATWYRTRRPG